MAISPLMVWDNTGGMQAHRLLAGTSLESVQLGAATGFAAAVLDTGQLGRLPRNRMVEFRRDLYLLHRGTVYKFNFGTKLWVTTGFTITNPPVSDDQAMTGLHVMDVGGVATLVGFYQQNLSSNQRGFWSTDGSSWNETANIASGSWPGYAVPFQGKLWMCGRDAAKHVTSWIPTQSTVDRYDLDGALGNGGRTGFLINFEGRLIWTGSPRAAADRQAIFFKEFVAGGWAGVSISGGANPGLYTSLLASPDGALGMFADGGNLYAVFWEHTAVFPNTNLGQMRVIQFVPSGGSGSSFAENDVTAAVIPVAWLTGGAFDNTGSVSTQVQVHVDLSVPGTPSIHWWRYDSFTAGASTFWTWNGPGTLAGTSAGQGAAFTLPVHTNSLGERIYTEGDFDVTMEDGVALPGKITFDFQAHTPLDGSSPANKQGRLFYSIGGADWTQATIHSDAPTVVSGADPAPTISGNLLQGITVGTSKFQATWDAAADGFAGAGEKVNLMLEVF